MRKQSLKQKLITIFLLTSTIPMILLLMFMFYNTSAILKKNTENLTQVNLKQMGDNIQLLLDSYEDMLYQIYTDDDVIKWVDNLNQGQDVPVTINQLRRFLQGLLNAKDYIRSITIITESGEAITYDQLTSATYENSWIRNFSMTEEEIYDAVSADNKTHIFSTEYGTSFANENFYLLHLSHRLIDYKKLDKHNGVVILSLDEKLLDNVLQTELEEGYGTNYLVDQYGMIISSAEKCDIGKAWGEEIWKTEWGNANRYTYHMDGLAWDIVTMVDQSIFVKMLTNNLFGIVSVWFLLFIVTLALIWRLSGELADSVKHVVAFMKKAESGDLSVQIPLNRKMSLEIETVAVQFNGTLKKLEYAIEKEKEAGEKQRCAEIKVLEAQINPHFLYNTLDTINWLALQREEFDISNAINSLGTILRYAIADSNGVVLVKDELEWLKKYIFLQQFRLKNKFICNIDADSNILECKIHKLLLQPFVENAIIHGFSKEQTQYILNVVLRKKDDFLEIIIRDNGKGMEPAIVESVNQGVSINTKETGHIGLDNAITRLHAYYSGGRIHAKSEMGIGTEIVLLLPISEI